MITVNGDKELDKTLNCEVQVLDYHTGKQKMVTLGAQQLEVLVFHDYLNIYRIPLTYSIMSSDGERINVQKIWDDKIDKICTKFDKERDIKLLRIERVWFGVPSCDIWYEKDYIVTKSS